MSKDKPTNIFECEHYTIPLPTALLVDEKDKWEVCLQYSQVQGQPSYVTGVYISKPSEEQFYGGA